MLPGNQLLPYETIATRSHVTQIIAYLVKFSGDAESSNDGRRMENDGKET